MIAARESPRAQVVDREDKHDSYPICIVVSDTDKA